MFSSLLLFLLILLSGCSPLYLFRAAYEEGKILWRRQPIEQLLENPNLDKETREKFELVLAVRTFARGRLHFTVRGSYEGYSYLDRPVLSYVLTAVPRTSLRAYTWWFPLVGRMPYKAFFSEDAATAKARSFQGRGYDTFVRPVSAFSTLGWFDDPLLAHLMNLDKVTLVEVIFHELFHNTLFIPEAVDFNESLANFVGNRAAIVFLRERFGKKSSEHLRAVRAWEEELEFSVMIHEASSALENLYERDLPEIEKLSLRREIFSRSQKEWTLIVADRPGHQYRNFSELEVNNAVIAHFMLYLGGLHLFESLYQTRGRDLGRLLKAVMDSVEKNGAPWDGVRGMMPSHSKRPVSRASGDSSFMSFSFQ